MLDDFHVGKVVAGVLGVEVLNRAFALGFA